MPRDDDTVKRPLVGPRSRQWADAVLELLIVAAAVVYVLTSAVWALAVWIGLSVVYLAAGFVVVWRGRAASVGTREEVRFLTRWTWVLPILSSVAGVNSAIIALGARPSASPGTDGVGLAFAASVGVVLSWMLLHVGFAHIYRAVDAAGPAGIEFPGERSPAVIDYLYFAFTIGTAFATSDARVSSLPVRRVVLIHSIVSFFYNALVVAVAIQVLQQLISA